MFETATFEAFLAKQEMSPWVCAKGDLEPKGCIENGVDFVRSSFFSAHNFSSIDDVLRALPAWVERKSRRMHQGAYQIPQSVFDRAEKASLRPPLPSLYEAAPLFLASAPVSGQPYILHKAVGAVGDVLLHRLQARHRLQVARVRRRPSSRRAWEERLRQEMPCPNRGLR